MVAPVRVGQKTLRTVGGPADRTAQFFGRSQNQCFFTIVIDFRAETATHVGRDHGQFVFRNAHHEGRNQQSRQMRVLRRCVKRIIAGTRIVIRGRGTWLDRVGDQTVVDQVQLGHMRGRLDRGVGRFAVVLDPSPIETDVGADLIVDQLATRNRL